MGKEQKLKEARQRKAAKEERKRLRRGGNAGGSGAAPHASSQQPIAQNVASIASNQGELSAEAVQKSADTQNPIESEEAISGDPPSAESDTISNAGQEPQIPHHPYAESASETPSSEHSSGARVRPSLGASQQMCLSENGKRNINSRTSTQ